MSLIVKIQPQSLLQTKLQAQLAEMSYQTVNGTRQTPRNFREGTLEVGKMHFTTPQDRITKEMIMDYQKSEQEKRTNIIDPTTGKQLLYQTTGLSDVIDTFKPTDYGPLLRPGTEDDVSTYEADYIQLYNDLNALKADAKTKDEEVSDKQVEIKKGEDVQDKKDENTTTQKNWRELNVQLKEVQDRIVKIESGGKKKEKELEDDIKVLDAKLLTLQAEIVALETEKLKLDGDLPTLQQEYKQI
jgi:hypothetical protein